MLEDSIRAWNPWWAAKEVPDELHGTQRRRLSQLLDLLDLGHVKDIVGVRRCGKTTLLYQLVDQLLAGGHRPEHIALLNFDDPAIFEAGFDELLDAVSTVHPDVAVLLLDEVQERDGWERWVRRLYDQGRFDQLLITGSSSSLLEGELARVLSGRHLTVRLSPFSFREYLVHRGQAWARWDNGAGLDADVASANKGQALHHLTAYMEEGGFPEVVGRDLVVRKRVLTQLFHDILARDVSARHGADQQLVRKLASVLLSNSGNPFTFRRLANATGMAPDTVSKYTGFLVDAFLFLELPPFSFKAQQRYRGPRKFYAIDPGLVASTASRPTQDRGSMLESVVVLELARRELEIYHWRDDDQREIDVLLAPDGRPEQALQITWSLDDALTRERELKALASAMDHFGLETGTVLTWDETDQLETEHGMVEVAPAWRFLLELDGASMFHTA